VAELFSEEMLPDETFGDIQGWIIWIFWFMWLSSWAQLSLPKHMGGLCFDILNTDFGDFISVSDSNMIASVGVKYHHVKCQSGYVHMMDLPDCYS
jgi:hypothetical protein